MFWNNILPVKSIFYDLYTRTGISGSVLLVYDINNKSFEYYFYLQDSNMYSIALGMCILEPFIRIMIKIYA